VAGFNKFLLLLIAGIIDAQIGKNHHPSDANINHTADKVPIQRANENPKDRPDDPEYNENGAKTAVRLHRILQTNNKIKPHTLQRDRNADPLMPKLTSLA